MRARFLAKFLFTPVLALALAAGLTPVAQAEEKKSFKLVWTIYVGFVPWDYAARSGIMKKWADKYGIEIEVVQANDYIESINQFTAGQYDAATMTNMDALTIPAAGGVDTTMLVLGDFSNGNDGLVLKGKGKSLEEIAGQRVNLVELSVSHYMLARALESVGLTERDVTVVNTSDADFISAFNSDDVTAMAAWNPALFDIVNAPEAQLVFDSTQIPGEIMDMLAVRTEVIEANPDFAKALVGAWYETMDVMSGPAEAATQAKAEMGEATGTNLEGYEAQLGATRMFYNPGEAAEFVASDQAVQTMDYVREFSFKHGLLGEGAPSPDVVGIAFPNGKVLGDPNNIKMRFDATYATMAAEGQL